LRSAAERRLASQYGAHKSWARTPDRSAHTFPARKALWDRLEREADPDNHDGGVTAAMPSSKAVAIFCSCPMRRQSWRLYYTNW
jgi:hypothetical protein